MTNSADSGGVRGDLLQHALEVYRDLSRALGERITQIKAGIGFDDDCNKHVDAIRSHQKALQNLLDLEVSLVKRTRSTATPEGVELDLHAARTEVLARLSVWLAAR